MGNFKGDLAKLPINLPFVRSGEPEVEIKMTKSLANLPQPKLMRKTTSMDS